MMVRALIFVFFAFVLLPPGIKAQVPSDTPKVQISGMVEDSHGFPVTTAIVELHSWSGGLIGTATTDAGGDFSFNVKDSGPFELRTFADGASQTVQITNPELESIVVRLPGAVEDSRPAAGSGNTISLNDLEAPAKAKAELNKAEKAMRATHLNRAWALVNQAVRDAPQWGKPYLMRGVLSMESGDYRSAQADLGVALTRNPRSALGLTEMGKLYAATGHLKLAGTYLKRALAIPPVLWPTYFEMGSLDMRRGDFAGAAAMAQMAIYDTPPPPAAIHFLAAEAADQLHHSKTADREYRSYLALATPSARTAKAITLARRRVAAIESGQAAARTVH